MSDPEISLNYSRKHENITVVLSIIISPKMGCSASSMVLSANNLINVQHKIVNLVVTDRTQELITFIKVYNYEIDINSAINFRGDTLLHYACYKNNKKLVEFLTARPDILRTKKNFSKKIPYELTTDQEIKKLCS